MTTDQIETAESTTGASNDSQASGASDSRAANEARQIIAKARYEAFRMVTDARTDADSILHEARAEAETIVGSSDANEAIAAENADLVAVNAALRVEYNELVDLINASQDLLEQLDVRLLDLATMPDTHAPDLASIEPGLAAAEGSQVSGYVFDYSPAVAPTPKPRKAKATERAESFYTRKSAKLPRIGREGGQDALDVVRSMRDRLREQDPS